LPLSVIPPFATVGTTVAMSAVGVMSVVHPALDVVGAGTVA
jgi:hypothetical protein